MRKYIRPQMGIKQADCVLLSGSGPDATSIGSPSVDNNAKGYSVWDEVNEQYNIKEEQNYGDKVYE